MKALRLEWAADTDWPVDLETIKAQLRIFHDHFDPVISDIHLPAAVSWAESFMHRSILSKTHTWVLSDFPRGIDQGITLPRGKTQSVSSIAYYSNNALTTLTGPSSSSPEGTDYREDLRGNSGGTLFPAYNETWPTVDTDHPSPVVITFAAGWTKALIPADIKHAITMFCADALEVTGGVDARDVDLDVKSRLLTPYRLSRW